MNESCSTQALLSRPAAGLPAAHVALLPDGSAHWARRIWSWCLAVTRLSPAAVCRESAALGEYDFHSHRDDPAGAPWFVEGGRRCGRCGKRFRV